MTPVRFKRLAAFSVEHPWLVIGLTIASRLCDAINDLKFYRLNSSPEVAEGAKKLISIESEGN